MPVFSPSREMVAAAVVMPSSAPVLKLSKALRALLRVSPSPGTQLSIRSAAVRTLSAISKNAETTGLVTLFKTKGATLLNPKIRTPMAPVSSPMARTRTSLRMPASSFKMGSKGLMMGMIASREPSMS